MSQAAVDAIRSESELVLACASELTPDQWEMPSACAGWRVQDVVAHLAAAFQIVADPSSMPDPGGDADGMEAVQEIPVAERRGWTPQAVVEANEAWRDKALPAFDLLQGDDIADLPLEMGDLGTHPMHLVANAYAFDHYTHLRFDLAAPNGPLDLEDLPRDGAVLAPTVEWLIAGLPQMCLAPLKAVVSAPFALDLTGPGGGRWTARAADQDQLAVVLEEGLADDAAFTATSSTHDFVGWSTTRTRWSEVVTVAGDRDYARAALDAVNLI